MQVLYTISPSNEIEGKKQDKYQKYHLTMYVLSDCTVTTRYPVNHRKIQLWDFPSMLNVTIP